MSYPVKFGRGLPVGLSLLVIVFLSACTPPLPLFDNPYDPEYSESPIRFAPSGTVLVSADPQTGETTVSVSWNDVPSALRYQLQIASSSEFADPEYDDDRIATSPVTWSGAALNTSYWGRVRYEAAIEYKGETRNVWSRWTSLGSGDPGEPLDFSEPVALQVGLVVPAAFQARGETHQFYFSSEPGRTYLLFMNDEFSGLADGADPTIEIRADSSSGSVILQLDENRDKVSAPVVVTAESAETWIVVTSDNPDTTFYDVRLEDAGGLVQDLTFPDPALQNEVQALAGPDTYVGQITGLSLSSSVTDLTGIDQLFALESIDVDFFSGVSDLAPVTGLENLRSLSVMYSSVTDLTPLSTMSSLRVLHLDGNAITDVTPLAELTGLQDVMVTDTNVADLSPMLVSGSQIEILWASGSSFTTVTGIGNLTNLKEVYLKFTNIDSGVGELSTLPELLTVDLESSTTIPAEDVTAIEDAYAGVSGFQLIRPDSSLFAP